MPARLTHGMVLAAGLGLRMRPITERLPKPLVEVAGRTLLDHALDRMEEAGIGTAVVNVHHLAHLVEAHLAARSRPRIALSDERALLLETGGGVARALPLLGEGPFAVTNSDALLVDGARPALAALAERWDDQAMDALLLLHPVARSYGYDGPGDFLLGADGRPERRGDRPAAPYLFTGTQILHPRLFSAFPDGPFSLNPLYDRALAAGRLFAAVNAGRWLHIGTPDALRGAGAFLARTEGAG